MSKAIVLIGNKSIFSNHSVFWLVFFSGQNSGPDEDGMGAISVGGSADLEPTLAESMVDLDTELINFD